MMREQANKPEGLDIELYRFMFTLCLYIQGAEYRLIARLYRIRSFTEL